MARSAQSTGCDAVSLRTDRRPVMQPPKQKGLEMGTALTTVQIWGIDTYWHFNTGPWSRASQTSYTGLHCGVLFLPHEATRPRGEVCISVPPSQRREGMASSGLRPIVLY